MEINRYKSGILLILSPIVGLCLLILSFISWMAYGHAPGGDKFTLIMSGIFLLFAICSFVLMIYLVIRADKTSKQDYEEYIHQKGDISE